MKGSFIMKLNKKILSVTICAAAMLSISSVMVSAENYPALSVSETSDSGMFIDGVANPYEDCTDLNMAYEISGVYLNAPEVKDIDNASSMVIRASKSLQMVVVTYLDKSGNDVIEIRKGIGTEDISGDYRVHKTTNILNVNGMEITVKGDSTDIYLAVWNDGYYSYSVFADENYPLIESDITDIAEKTSSETLIGGDPRTWGPDEDFTNTDTNLDMINPYTEYSSLKEANEAAGFSLRVSKMLNGYKLETVRVLDEDNADEDALIEAVYSNGKNKIIIRKSSGESDISGDYNEYKKTYKSGKTVYKGENRSKISLCTWQKKDYSYSVFVENGTVSLKTMKYIKLGVR